MTRALVLFLLLAAYARANDDNIYLSKSLRAHLLIVPFKNAEADGPLFQVRLELVNLGVEGSAGTIPVEIRLSLLREDLHLRVVDEMGNELPKSMRPEDHIQGPWNATIPPDGHLDFAIGEGGDKAYEYSRSGPGKLLTFGLGTEWIIPKDGKTYYLCGTLKRTNRMSPRNWSGGNPLNWDGSIDLKKVKIPK